MSAVELVPVEVLITPARMALAGFLAGYSGRTHEAYALDLRMFHRWCSERELELFAATRGHIELYARGSKTKAGPEPPSPGDCRRS